MCLCICKGEHNHSGIIITEISSAVMFVQPETKWEKLEFDFKVSFPISGSHEMNEVQQHINEFDIQSINQPISPSASGIFSRISSLMIVRVESGLISSL